MQGRAKPIIAGFGCMPPSLDDLRLLRRTSANAGQSWKPLTDPIERGAVDHCPKYGGGLLPLIEIVDPMVHCDFRSRCQSPIAARTMSDPTKAATTSRNEIEI